MLRNWTGNTVTKLGELDDLTVPAVRLLAGKARDCLPDGMIQSHPLLPTQLLLVQNHVNYRLDGNWRGKSSEKLT